MAKKKKKKNGKIKKNGNVGGKADVHLNSNGGRNKSLLGHNAIFTPDVIDDIHIKSQLGRYRMRGMALMKKIVAGKKLWNYDNLEPTEKKGAI